MAAPASASIIFVPGTLSFDGTALGMLRGMIFRPERSVTRVWAEEWGCYVDDFSNGEGVTFMGILRYPDATAMSVIPDPGSLMFSTGQTNRPGTSLYSRAGVLLFTPLTSTYPGVKLYKAIPAIDEAAELQHSMGKEYGLAVAFHGTPDSSGRVYACGPVGSLP
jgi:hypothetical protein